jgi:hypothetical protein
MDVWVERTRLAQLIGRQDTVRRSFSGKPLTDLTADLVKARMPDGTRARFLGTMSGGDHSHAVSSWAIPGIGRRTVTVDRVTLSTVLAQAEPWSPPPPPDVRARQAAALARLRSLRPAPPGEADQLSLLG